jgi:c-di-AMP phosphodiesterase-like protein
MLREFNYVAVDDTNQPCKSKVKTSNQASSFLKRYIDSKGNLDTKTKDIWKKLSFGADYSGTRKSRMTYLYRRVNDLAITSEKELRRVSLYMSFIDNFERFFFNLSYNERISRQKTVYDLLFTFTTGFTNNIRQVWTKFIPLVRFNLFEINQRSEHFYKYLKSVYRQNYWTYDTKREYVDYWVERKQSVTVSKALRNIKEVQIICDVSIFKKLHGPFVKNGKR